MNKLTPAPVTATPLNQPDFVTALARGLSVIRALRGQKKNAEAEHTQFAKLWRGGAIRIEDL